LVKQAKVQPSQDNHRNMENKLDKGSTATKLVSQQQHKPQYHKKQHEVFENEKTEYAKNAYLNVRSQHIKNDIVYKMGDKHNSTVNNNGKEFIKFTKANSHQEKHDNDKASNSVSYASKFNTNVSHMSYHAFDAFYVLTRNKYGKVVVLYVGPHHNKPNTCVWVPKTLVINVRGPKQVWVPNTKA
jgi:hypothetical protein